MSPSRTKSSSICLCGVDFITFFKRSNLIMAILEGYGSLHFATILIHSIKNISSFASFNDNWVIAVFLTDDIFKNCFLVYDNQLLTILYGKEQVKEMYRIKREKLISSDMFIS